MSKVPISVLIPTKNEEKNLPRCLDAIADWADEIVLVDSRSTDRTVEIGESYGCSVIQFDYKGGWPKKRNWALDTYDFKHDWILLLDSDEIMLPAVKDEIHEVVKSGTEDGYWVLFQIYFLGKLLKHGGTALWKLSLFRKGKGRYEKRLENQETNMADMEVHEHVVVDGSVGRLTHPIRHENINRLDRYIQKHNEYSNWEARLFRDGNAEEIKPDLFGNQAQRRRALKKYFMNAPGIPVGIFAYFFLYKRGFLDGKQGLIYSAFRGIQYFHIKAKIFEEELEKSGDK